MGEGNGWGNFAAEAIVEEWDEEEFMEWEGVDVRDVIAPDD